MRLQSKLNVTLSDDIDQLHILSEISNQVVDDTSVSSWDGKSIILPPSALNVPVAISSSAVKYFGLIVQSNEVLFRINSTSAPAISVKPNPATAVDPLLPYQKRLQYGNVWLGPMGLSAPMTSLFLTNPSSVDEVRCYVMLVGEAV